MSCRRIRTPLWLGAKALPRTRKYLFLLRSCPEGEAIGWELRHLISPVLAKDCAGSSSYLRVASSRPQFVGSIISQWSHLLGDSLEARRRTETRRTEARAGQEAVNLPTCQESIRRAGWNCSPRRLLALS